MKAFFVVLIALTVSTRLFAQENKGWIAKDTKLFSLTANIRFDHLMIGYAKPNVKSVKLIYFSVFTSVVKGHKDKCKLGAYYQDSDLPPGDKIYFVSIVGSFAKMKYVSSSGQETIFYFKKRHLNFE